MRIWSILLIKWDRNGVYIWVDVSFYISTSWWVSLLVDQWVPDGICSQVLRSTSVAFWEHQNSPIKIDCYNIVGSLHHPFWLQYVLVYHFCTVETTFWLRITDEGSVLEMCIRSILLIESDSKWCIHLSRSIFLYSKHNYSGILQAVFGVSQKS